MKYAVVKVGKHETGKIKSIHRSFWAAMNACPAIFFTVKKVSAQFKVGDYVI